MDRRAWWAAVHGVTKSWTQLSDFTFTFHFHTLEKEMATRSSVLAWRIPGTAEPGGLPSVGSHRVRHNWSDLAAAALHFLRQLHTARCSMRQSLFFLAQAALLSCVSAYIQSSHLLHGVFPDLFECQRDFFLSFWLHWVFVTVCRLRGDSSYGVWASHCCGFSDCRAWALGTWT